MSTTTIIADDHPLLRLGLRNIFAAGSIDVLAEADDGLHLLSLLETLQPQVVLLDLNMPRMDGVEAGRVLCKRYPNVKILILSMSTDACFIRETWQMGAKGYVLKTANPEELVAAVQTVALGGSYYSPPVSEKLMAMFTTSQGRLMPPLFSNTELRLLQLICNGYTLKEMSASVDLAKKTVEHYVERMKEKVEAKNVAELAAYSVFHGFVDFERR